MTTTNNISNRIFGYARVSTKDQHTDRQVQELRKYVEDDTHIIVDKATGANFDRPNYQALRQLTTSGDTIYIKSLDRLGRNKEAVKQELMYFKDKGVMVRVLDVPTTLCDFSQYGDLQRGIMDMVNNILIEVLGTIAEQERKTIKQRQKEGIAAAKASGRQMGRPQKEVPENWDSVYQQWEHGDITAKRAMELLEMKRTTFYKMVKLQQQTAPAGQPYAASEDDTYTVVE